MSYIDEFILMACDGIWDVMDNDEACLFIRTCIEEGGRDLGLMLEQLEVGVWGREGGAGGGKIPRLASDAPTDCRLIKLSIIPAGTSTGGGYSPTCTSALFIAAPAMSFPGRLMRMVCSFVYIQKYRGHE